MLQDVSWIGLTLHLYVVVRFPLYGMSVVIEYHSGLWNFMFSQTRGVVILFHHSIPVQSIYP